MIANQCETVITGFHSETTESEVIQLLKEMINEIGMDFGSARIECLAKPITHAFIHFANDGERNKFISFANMWKRELGGRKSRITRSMELKKDSKIKKEWSMSNTASIRDTTFLSA